MHNEDKSKLFGKWLDNDLNQFERTEFEQLCAQDKAFAEKVESANQMMMAAESYQPESVPNWDRVGTFEQAPRQGWWNWHGLPALSFATSFLAIVMVVSGFEVRTDDGAMTISFAQAQDPKKIELLVDQKLNEYQQNQQQALNLFAQTMQQQQLDASTKLTQYLLSSSRQERREDFAELIKFVNEQRSDDQLFYARQLNKLQDDIYGSVDSATWPAASADDPIENEE